MEEQIENEIYEKLSKGLYKLKKKQETNSLRIWKIFSMIEREDGSIVNGYVYCSICEKIRTNSGNDRNRLDRHMRLCLKRKETTNVDSQQFDESGIIQLTDDDSLEEDDIIQISDDESLKEDDVIQISGDDSLEEENSSISNPIWQTFALHLKEDDGKAELSCRLCKMVLERNFRNSTDVKKLHICLRADKSNSDIEMPSKCAAEQLIKSEISNKLNAGIFKAVVQQSYPESLASNLFDVIKTKNGSVIDDYVCCSNCKNVLNSNLSSAPFHSCYLDLLRLSVAQDSSEQDVEDKIKAGIYKVKPCLMTKIPIWEKFELILRDDGKLVQDMVCCRRCRVVLKYNGCDISNLYQHKCLEEKRTQSPASARKEMLIEIEKRKREINENVCKGVYRTLMHPDRRYGKIWKVFASIIDTTTDTPIEGFLYCTKCAQTVIDNGWKTHELTRHPCVNKSSGRDKSHHQVQFENYIKTCPPPTIAIKEVAAAGGAKRRKVVKNMQSNDENDSIWLRFERISNNDALSGVVSCRQCKSCLSYNESTKMQLETHICVSTAASTTATVTTAGAAVQEEIIDSTSTMICVKEEYTTQSSTYNNLPKSPELNKRKNCDNVCSSSLQIVNLNNEGAHHTDFDSTSEFDEIQNCANESSSSLQIVNVNEGSHHTDLNAITEVGGKQGAFQCDINEFNEMHSSETVKIENDLKNEFYSTNIKEEIQDSASPKTYKGSTNSNSLNQEIKEQTLQICLQWAIEDVVPLNDLEGSGFRRLITNWLQRGAKYNDEIQKLDRGDSLIDSGTVSEYIKQKAKAKSIAIKLKLQEICSKPSIISIDFWCDKNAEKIFFKANLNFNKNNELFHIILGVKSLANRPISKETIELKLNNILSEFGLDWHVNDLVFITERRDNSHHHLDKALKEFTHLKCSRYLLEKVLNSTLENKAKELQDILKTSKQIIKHFKFDVNTQKPYDLLKTIINNWSQISENLQVHNKEESLGIPETLTASFPQLIKLCENFEYIFKRLQANHSPSLCFVIPSIERLKLLCQINSTDTPDIKALKVNLLKNLDGIWLTNITIWHKTACFLYPPANGEQGMEINEIKEFCIKQMKHLKPPTEKDNQLETETAETTDNVNAEIDDFDFFFPNLITRSNDIHSTTSQEEQEIQSYCLEKIRIDKSFNVLQWWNTNSEKYPLLSRLALRILAIPAVASTTRSQEILELNKNLINKNSFVEEIVFLNSLINTNLDKS